MSKAGRPAIKYDPKEAAQVLECSQNGVPQKDIASILGMSSVTMLKLYGEDYRRGAAIAKAKIGAKLFQRAMEGDTAVLIFCAKTRLGWRETSRLELADGDGDASGASTHARRAKEAAKQLQALRRKRAADAKKE